MDQNHITNNSAGKIVEFDHLDSATQDLIRKCISAREQAYCPYSKFKVGSALLCNDGTIYTGCNVENASIGVSICAERTAIVKAVSDGNRQYKTIAVSAGNEDTFVAPCGACRQFIVEFGGDVVIYLAKPDYTKVLVTSIKELLPYSFTSF